MGPLPDRNHPQSGDDGEVADLLAAASRGDEAAWRRLLDLYGRRVYALVKSRCRQADVAEEVTQSVFATVATKLGSGYTEQGRFESWLFRIAMNRVRDEIRGRQRHAEATDPEVLAGLAPAQEEPAGADHAALGRMRAAMLELPEADREIVELRHHGEMSFKQMADLLDEPLGTLLARHHRALKKLKQLMDAQEIETEGGEA